MSARRLTSSPTPAISSGRTVMRMRIGPVGVAADDVAEQAQAVLVGPLEVVEEDREGSDGRQLGDGDRGQVVRAQELLRGRQLRQRRVVPARQHVDRALHGGLRRGGPGRELLDLPAAEDRAGEHERPAQLLVRGQSERREPLGLRQLLGSHHQARLADARLALDAHAREPAACRGRQLLADRGHLGGPADELEPCADSLQRERAKPTLGPLDQGDRRCRGFHRHDSSGRGSWTMNSSSWLGARTIDPPRRRPFGGHPRATATA